MQEATLGFLNTALLTIALPLVMGIITKYLRDVAKPMAEAYVQYRDKMFVEARKLHAEEVVRAVEQAARSNLLAAADRHHTAVSMLLGRIPGMNPKDANALVLAAVAALKEEFKKADELSANKVSESGEPLVRLDGPLQ